MRAIALRNIPPNYFCSPTSSDSISALGSSTLEVTCGHQGSKPGLPYVLPHKIQAHAATRGCHGSKPGLPRVLADKTYSPLR
jgi:hypothetical protein